MGVPVDLETLIGRYEGKVGDVVHREPRDDSNRWRSHVIGGRRWQVIQPVTFTPYASVRPCSARCHFCSENLREKKSGLHASALRPSGQYFEQLQRALLQLQGLPLSYSLSGLEMTDDRGWFIRLLSLLGMHAESSPVEQRVLYSNASGLLALDFDPALRDAVREFGFSWVELSRHHPDENSNQAIMRFRPSSGAASNQAFSHAVATLQAVTEVKLVCIVQSGGVDTLAGLHRYLAWARSLGVRHVIFRELSQLDRRYRANATFRYVAKSRVSVAGLLQAYLANEDLVAPSLLQSTYGYYFRNLVVEDNGVRITFESSDYSVLHAKHDSGRVYKLVFHGNGNLCADWRPDRHVLFSADVEGVFNGQ